MLFCQGYQLVQLFKQASIPIPRGSKLKLLLAHERTGIINDDGESATYGTNLLGAS